MDYFNWKYYINKYKDLQKANINTKEKAYAHWEKYGIKENRICNKIFENINISKYAKDKNIKTNNINEMYKYYYNNINNNINNFDLNEKKVMFISPDIIWNMCLGNSIWARTFVSLIKKKYNCNLTVFECRMSINSPMKNIYKEELNNIKFINILDKNNTFIKNNDSIAIEPNKLIKFIISQFNNYDYIIVRGWEIMKPLINQLENNDNLLNKLIYIVIDRPTEDVFIKKLKNIIHMTFIRYIRDKETTNIPQYIIPPLIIDENIYKNQYSISNTKYDMCIVGTLHKKSNLENILNIIKNYPEKTIIIAGKYLNIYKNEINNIISKFKKYKNITFNLSLKGIPEETSHEIILNSKIGLRFDIVVECLSSKVMNYICFNRLLIVQDIETHKYILSNEYPFFLNKNDLLCSNLSVILENMTEEKINLAYDLVTKAKNKLNPEFLIKNNFSM